MNTPTFLLIVFVALWVATFIPSWRVLLKLMALAASPSRLGLSFWIYLVVYRVLIALPYIALLVLGQDVLPDIIKILIGGFLVAGLAFTIIRFWYRELLISKLWWAYGYVYDGLLHFAPYRRLIKKVIATAKSVSSHPATILELGCGSGNVLVALTDAYPAATITGVDSSKSMLSKAHKKAKGATIIQQDATYFLQSQVATSYDLIVMQNVLYAIDDRPKLWRELSRVLTPNGVVVITNSDRDGSKTITKEHLKYGKWYELLSPKLLLVGVIDAYISQLSKAGSFHFIGADIIARETSALFVMSDIKRCYGDVNILFTLRKVHHEL